MQYVIWLADETVSVCDMMTGWYTVVYRLKALRQQGVNLKGSLIAEYGDDGSVRHSPTIECVSDSLAQELSL